MLNKHLIRIENRNGYVWNVATDLAINQFIKGLPDGARCPECNIFVRKTAQGAFPAACPLCGFKLDIKLHKCQPLQIKEIEVGTEKIKLDNNSPSESYYDTLWKKMPKQVVMMGSGMTNQREKNAKGSMENGDGQGQGQGEGQGEGQGQSGQGDGSGQAGQQSGSGGDGSGKVSVGQQFQNPNAPPTSGQGGGGQGQQEQKDAQGGGSGDKKDDKQGKGKDGKETEEEKQQNARNDLGSGIIEINGQKVPMTMDNHEAWAAGADNKEMAHEKVKDMVQKAMHKVNQKSQGTLPDYVRGLIDAVLAHKTVNWKSELRKFVGYEEFASFISSRKRLNRRFPLMQPGYVVQRMAHFVVAVDSSGSIDDEEFAKFFKEIDLMRAAKISITYVECDAAIQKVEQYRRKPKQIERVGYGGTDFRPVFEFAKKRHAEFNGQEFKLKGNKKVDGLIYLTDGMGTFPKKQDIICPVIWVMTPNHSDYGWNEGLGKKIIMEED